MGLTRIIIICSISVSLLEQVLCQDYFEPYLDHRSNEPSTMGEAVLAPKLLDLVKTVRHMQHMRTQDTGELREIPKSFEVSGENPRHQFAKYVRDIEGLAEKENLTVVYRVKVEIEKPNAKKASTKKPTVMKKHKSKKYNVPLKKKSMRLSNFEIIMRKLADTNGQKVVINPVLTTEETGTRQMSTTTKIPILKYKPIISRVRPNYAKKNAVKPVRKHEITLR